MTTVGGHGVDMEEGEFANIHGVTTAIDNVGQIQPYANCCIGCGQT